MSKKYYFVILFCVRVFSVDQLHLSYEDLSALVRERNQHVRAFKMFQEAAETETGHLERSYLPKVTATAGAETFSSGPNGIRSQPFGSVQGNINVFRGGRDLLIEREKQAFARKTTAEFEENFQETLQEVREIYWQLIYQNELLLILAEALTQNEKNGRGAERRIKAGLVSETDRIEFDLNALKIKQEMIRLKLNSSNAQRLMLSLLGYSEDTKLTVLEKLPHSHEASTADKENRLSNHRSVRGALADRDGFSARSSEAFRWWTPSVDVYGGYSLYTLRERDYVLQSDRLEPVLGVKLTINIFDGLQSRNISTVASLRAEAMESEAKQIERNLQARLQSIRQELEVSHELIHTSEDVLDKARRYLERTVTEYERGMKNSPDVLSATSRYYETKARVLELKRDYLIAKAKFKNLMGE